MKKIFSILVLSFLAFFAKGQMQQINAFGYTYNALEARKIFNIPSGPASDTSALSQAYKNALKPGAFFYDSINNIRYIWKHDPLGDHWIVDNAGGGGGGSDVTDTIFVTPIGVQAGMKQILFAVDGNLRVSNFGTGYGMGIGQQSDTLTYYFIDTSLIAYKQWIINQYGVGTGGIIAGLDGVLAVNQDLTANRHAGMGTFTWNIDGTPSGTEVIHVTDNTPGSYGIRVEGNAIVAIAGNTNGNGTGVYGSTDIGNGVYGSASAGGTGVFGSTQNGYGGLFTATVGVPLLVRSDNTSTNSANLVATFYRNISGGGTAAVGFGGDITMQSVDPISQPQFSNGFEWTWTQVTPTLNSKLRILGRFHGGVEPDMDIYGDGQIGFPDVANWINAANNAAAIGAGVCTGCLYRNGDVVNIVH